MLSVWLILHDTGATGPSYGNLLLCSRNGESPLPDLDAVIVLLRIAVPRPSGFCKTLVHSSLGYTLDVEAVHFGRIEGILH